MPLDENSQWWRRAVVYQIYPRSFADADGDGTGDVLGMIGRLEYLAALGVDAIWVSPGFPRRWPTVATTSATTAASCRSSAPWSRPTSSSTRAHDLGLRVLIDLVPNHSSDEHPWFQQALAAGPGSPERALYLFRAGQGKGGDEPPNNWPAMFGGGPGSGRRTPTALPASGTCTCSTRSSRTGTGRTRPSPTSSTPSCGSGSTGGSTASGSTWPTRWRRRRDCRTSSSIP